MKKLFLLAFSLQAAITASAAEFTIEVSNFQFTPSSLTVTLGDVVRFVWINGNHTTTSSTIPVGAAAWNDPMNSGNTLFEYTPAVTGVYNYICIPHEAFGMIGAFTVEAPVPVVLKYFQTSESAAGKALLQWATASEQETQLFEVMRSIDGIQYNKIGEVAATGNSNSEVKYTYTDNTTGDHRFYYYTLKIKDKDGSEVTSPVSLFRNLKAASKIITKLSPNPLKSPAHLMLEFEAEQTSSLKAYLYDANGNLVLEETMHAVTGFNKGHLHIGNITAGGYTIVFILGDVKETYNIVVQ